MKITYTSPNRSHHYPYAKSIHDLNHLYAFVSGFSRLSPRSSLREIDDKLKRHDFFQTLYLTSLRANAPQSLIGLLNSLSNRRLDEVSYKWAKESDVFIFYRTQGLRSTTRLHQEGSSTLCVMEEVNSHVEYANQILLSEYQRLGYREIYRRDIDYDLRLKTYEQADCILCPSKFVEQSFLSKGFSADRLIKVNFGFPPIARDVLEYNKTKNGVFRLLYVGQLHYRKGLHYAIEAFRKLRHPKKEFIIVGPKTTFTGLEKTRIPDGVYFTGPLKGEELQNQYRKANVFVLPSLEEGLALVQGEALSSGLPLIITHNTGGEDIIKNGREGFVVSPGEIDPLAERMQEMADNELLAEQMSLAALETAKNLGSWSKASGRLIAQLENILKERNRRPN